MKKFIFFVFCIISFGIGIASADNTVVIVADDIDLFYWDRAYNSFLAYYEYKADADYKIGLHMAGALIECPPEPLFHPSL